MAFLERLLYFSTSENRKLNTQQRSYKIHNFTLSACLQSALCLVILKRTKHNTVWTR